MILYHNPLSANCRRVTMTAAYLGLPLEEKTIDFTKGDHKTPEYLAMNANGMIPTLTDGDFKLWESRAIIQYLATKKPEREMLGKNAREQADVTPAVYLYCSGGTGGSLCAAAASCPSPWPS